MADTVGEMLHRAAVANCIAKAGEVPAGEVIRCAAMSLAHVDAVNMAEAIASEVRKSDPRMRANTVLIPSDMPHTIAVRVQLKPT